MDQFARAAIRMVTLSEILAVAEDETAARDIGITLNRIYFLFLDGVRKALSPHQWRAKQAVIHAAAAAVLRHETGPDDVCVQINDEQYLLIFGEDDVEAVAGRCTRIADALENRLYGQKGRGQRARGQVVIRTASRVFADGSIHRRPVNEDLANAQLFDEPETVEERYQQKFGSVFSAHAREARRTNLLQALEDDHDEPLVYGYTPLWHCKEGRIASYLCRPRRGNGAHAEFGYAALGDAPDAGTVGQFDTYGIEECLFTLKKVCDSGARIGVVAPVHFETLASRAARSSLTAFLAAIPRRYRRLLTLQLAEVPAGVPDARLTEITANLAGAVHGLSVAIRMAECPTLHILGQRAGQFARSKVNIITIDFEGHIGDDSLERATRLATRLAPRGLQFAAVNVPAVAALCELSISDFAWLAGPAIGAETIRPERPAPFSMRDLERADPAVQAAADTVYI